MIKLTTSEARQDFSNVIRGVKKGERFLLNRHGKGVAAIVSVEDLAVLQMIEDRRDREAARAALEDAEANGTVPWEKIKADLGL
jgi:prevent-host-death family protein